MTPEAQRIAIAEACGWRCKEGVTWYAPNSSIELLIHKTPAYPNDLNAMHEAEKTLPHNSLYYSVLYDITKATDRTGIGNHDHSKAISATAAQRAEAFLRTVGKWDDSK